MHFILNEYGFLPVPPPCHDVSRAFLPSVFGNGKIRSRLWGNLSDFFDFLIENTSIRSAYIDGDYISAEDEPGVIEVGVELPHGITRDELARLKAPFIDEWEICVNWYSPQRPGSHNFHEAFQRPDPDLSRARLPDGLRKGYLRVSL
jgi:hypothetical protein